RTFGDAHAPHPSPKLAAIDVVGIAQKVAWGGVIGECLDDLLRRPGGSGGIGSVEVYDSSALMQEDHKHVEHAEGRRRHDEEVDGDEVGEVVLKERAPGLRGWLGAARHETRNGALRNVESQLEQLAVNAWRAPKRIGRAPWYAQYSQAPS